MGRHLRAFVVVVLATAGAVSIANAAEGRYAAYQGAWLADDIPCEEVFNTSGKGVTFKRPVNLFISGFIISGNRVTTPHVSCQIRSSKSLGDRDALTLNCAGSVMAGGASAVISKSEDGTLKRYFKDDDKSGATYKLCSK